MENESFFQRTELLLGTNAMRALAKTRVIVVGTGGVGSWCAEALARTAVGHLTLVDSDRVCASNVNRQLMATSATIGEPKVSALARRLREINPAADIKAVDGVYSADTASTFKLEEFDYVIDAIDSVADKAHLIRHALSIPSVTLFSSMGAASASAQPSSGRCRATDSPARSATASARRASSLSASSHACGRRSRRAPKRARSCT